MPGLSARDRFQIPDVIDPPNSVCITMQIPDDPIHIANFYGALYQIAFGPNYQNDDAHSAKALVQVWRRYLSTLKIDACPSPVPPIQGGLLEDFEMPLRVDCDCNVFVTCCDGTEKQIFTADQVRALAGGQPGGGTPVPPAGSCKAYDATVHSGESWLLPAVVNTGDTLAISVDAGATTSDSPLGKWWCPNGQQFFASDCIGTGETDASALNPAILTGRLMWAIGGVYYDAMAGPVTVPGGIVNGLAALVSNYLTPGTYAGTDTATVTFCNNVAPAWTHFFDFALNPSSAIFTLPLLGGAGPYGVYVPGVGYQQSLVFAGGDYNRSVYLRCSLPFHKTSIAATFTYSQGTFTSVQSAFAWVVTQGSVTLENNVSYPTVPLSPQANAIDDPAIVQLDLQVLCGLSTVSDPGGDCVLSSLTISGIGTDPF